MRAARAANSTGMGAAYFCFIRFRQIILEHRGRVGSVKHGTFWVRRPEKHEHLRECIQLYVISNCFQSTRNGISLM